MDVGGFHQEIENLAEQRNRLMRFRGGPNMPIESVSQIHRELRLNSLDDSIPWQRMDLTLAIRRPRQLGIMKHDEPIIPCHVDISLNPVSAVLTCFRKGGERVLGCGISLAGIDERDLGTYGTQHSHRGGPMSRSFDLVRA